VWSDRRLRGHAALVQRMSDDAERSTSGADLGLIERPRSDLGGVRQPAAERAAKAKSVLLPCLQCPVTGWSRPRNGKRSARRGKGAGRSDQIGPSKGEKVGLLSAFPTSLTWSRSRG
jgi:hypothetical protein